MIMVSITLDYYGPKKRQIKRTESRRRRRSHKRFVLSDVGQSIFGEKKLLKLQ